MPNWLIILFQCVAFAASIASFVAACFSIRSFFKAKKINEQTTKILNDIRDLSIENKELLISNFAKQIDQINVGPKEDEIKEYQSQLKELNIFEKKFEKAKSNRILYSKNKRNKN